jgi:hypothetical protein
MQLKDIPDQHVVALAARWEADPWRQPCVLDALIAEGVPAKLALTKIRRLSDRGYLDWGVSPRCAWPTGRNH